MVDVVVVAWGAVVVVASGTVVVVVLVVVVSEMPAGSASAWIGVFAPSFGGPQAARTSTAVTSTAATLMAHPPGTTRRTARPRPAGPPPRPPHRARRRARRPEPGPGPSRPGYGRPCPGRTARRCGCARTG